MIVFEFSSDRNAIISPFLYFGEADIGDMSDSSGLMTMIDPTSIVGNIEPDLTIRVWLPKIGSAIIATPMPITIKITEIMTLIVSINLFINLIIK